MNSNSSLMGIKIENCPNCFGVQRAEPCCYRCNIGFYTTMPQGTEQSSSMHSLVGAIKMENTELGAWLKR
jgi:hypothetical protein